MYLNLPSLIAIVIRNAIAPIEERVCIFDAVMNLGYAKRTIFALRLFLLTRGPTENTNDLSRS